jgi:dienelactone hydrolase
MSPCQDAGVPEPRQPVATGMRPDRGLGPARSYAPSQFHAALLAATPRAFAWQGGGFARWQRRLRERLHELVGEFPGSRPPLDVCELGREETGDYTATKLVFTAEEGADVPGYLLVPHRLSGRAPAMVCLQGHSPGMHISVGLARDDRDRESIAGDRDFAVQAATRGYVALAIEQRCFGERSETEQAHRWDHTCLDAVFHSLMLGRTMIGERVWDVMRAVDLLHERPEVDAGRIGCMGNSGGGTVTFYAACLDERIALAVCSCSFCTFADSIMRIQHCGDNYVPGLLRVAESGELAGLIAPRNLLVVAGETDDIFPIDGVRRAFATACDIFAAAGCPGRVHLVVGPNGHRFYADLAWPHIVRSL